MRSGRPVYDWTVLDRIFDTYLARGVRPYAQIGFMPKALSTNPEPYQHEWRPGLRYDLITTGWAYPPKDYAKWAELVYQWVKHCVERYGAPKSSSGTGRSGTSRTSRRTGTRTPEEFYKLHDYAIAAVRRALPTARVGGPDVAGTAAHSWRDSSSTSSAGRTTPPASVGTPTDFLAFHAKGSPSFVDGHVRMGIADPSRDDRQRLPDDRAVARAEEQADRHRRVRSRRLRGVPGPAARLSQRHDVLELHRGELRAQTRLLAAQHGVNLEGALTWAFEFEDQPYFAGFRALATNGIDLPVLNVFRMFAKMGGERIAAESSGDVPLERDRRKRACARSPDVAALASLDGPQARRHGLALSR